jgi:hypothetical protein
VEKLGLAIVDKEDDMVRISCHVDYFVKLMVGQVYLDVFHRVYFGLEVQLP